MVKITTQGKPLPKALDLDVSPVYIANQNAKKRIVVNQGGTRSGKTYSILQLLLVYCFTHKGKIIDIVRKTRQEMRATVLTDFVDILKKAGVYQERYHNKTHDEFYIRGNTVRFLGLDKAQKKRGAKRDVLYINEANGLTLEDWVQLSIRTTEKIYIDFNPSEYFWVNEQILEKRDDFDFIKSTYLDNYDYLPPDQVKEIEHLIQVDDYYYKVYVLGELAQMKGKIYNGYELIDPEAYDALDYSERIYGLDFGYEHPTALMEVKIAQETVNERQRYFEKHRTDDELITWMIANDISQTDEIYADPAYPASIAKLLDAGFNVYKAKKDVKDGIRFCQGLKRRICKSSTDYIKTIGRYKWKQNADGKVFDEPVKVDDDLEDAMRYAEYTHLKRLIGD
jgi:phage terminase large subunit